MCNQRGELRQHLGFIWDFNRGGDINALKEKKWKWKNGSCGKTKKM